jgi:Pyruvate/2-oxoacid:ferredoxin oxidoreductase delta subunit
MKIDPKKCTACMNCLIHCPASAIILSMERPKKAVVSQELCFECGVCRRLDICPENAFIESEEAKEFPRIIRALLSDPNTVHDKTLVPGRGTEECKTNDVTGRIKPNELGICIEFGRPGVGCTFKDISLMTTRLMGLGVFFEENNPLTALMDKKTGEFSDKLSSQRILSAIIEIKVKAGDFEKVMEVVLDTAHEINTVFSLSVISRFGQEGDLAVIKQLEKIGVAVRPNAKINLGMGAPIIQN